MNLLPRLVALALGLIAHTSSFCGELQFEHFHMPWPDGYVRDKYLSTPEKPVFLNEDTHETLSVTVYQFPTNRSATEVEAQRQKWLTDGAQRMASSRPGTTLVSPPQREALSEGSMLVWASAVGKISDRTSYVLQFLVVSPSASAAYFVVSGPGNAHEQHIRFRPYFEQASWK